MSKNDKKGQDGSKRNSKSQNPKHKHSSQKKTQGKQAPVKNPYNIPDPDFHLEAAKYENPVPSRRALLDFLAQHKQWLNLKEIAEKIGVRTEEEFEALRRRLKAMVNAGQLVINRKRGYGVRKQVDLIRGRVEAHADGYGFLVSPEIEDDAFILPRSMKKVMDGDTVLASVQPGQRRGRLEAHVVEVIERAHSTVAGRFKTEDGISYVTPDNVRLQDILIRPEGVGNAKQGDFVTVLIKTYPDGHRMAIGDVVAVLGKKMNHETAMELAQATENLPSEWPEAVLEEAGQIPQSVTEEDFEDGVVDIRQLPLVTIDGADARDFDDAVYAEVLPNGNWKLLVAIADVSHYVKPGSALDEEAYNRGTSVYFPNKVIPMLPLELSNGICSLNPGVDRRCMVCEMEVDAGGNIKGTTFYQGVMHSHARMTYDSCWEFLSEGKRPAEWSDEVVQSVQVMEKVYRAMEEEKRRRGALEFSSTDIYFIIDENGEVAEIVPYERNDAHKLIENFMIAANRSAAAFIEKNKVPSPYRVHEPPPETKLGDLVSFLQGIGIKPELHSPPTPKDFERLLEQVQDRPDKPLIETVILRSQSLAAYEPENRGHFGLALDDYTHYTSPIRRYPDLLVHRALSYIIRGKKGPYLYSPEKMEEMCEHCSMTERRAEKASRDVESRLKCMYMEKYVGEEFTGRVTGVTHFGLFVSLDKTLVDGLVHVTSLPNDYYKHDPIQHKLVGERTGLQFQMADRLKVRVARVDVDARKIDFEFVEKLSH